MVLAAGPAPQGEHDREAREAEHEYEPRDPRKGLAQQRPFDEAPDRARPHAELRDEAPRLSRHRRPQREQEAHRERQVEEHVREQDAGESVETLPARGSDEARDIVEPPRAPVDGDDPEHRDDGRHDQRQADELQQPRPSRQPFAPRKRPRHRNGETGAERGREQRLPERERDDPAQVAIVGQRAKIDVRRGGEQCAERRRHDACEQRQRERPRPEPERHSRGRGNDAPHRVHRNPVSDSWPAASRRSTACDVRTPLRR